jgi:hypothetical protein
MVFNITQPTSALPIYQADSQTDLIFLLQGNVLCDTIRIQGEILFSNTPDRSMNPEDPASAKYLTPIVGAHSAFNSISTRVNGSQIESIADYPAYCSQVFGAIQSTREVFSNSTAMTEMRCGNAVSLACVNTADVTGDPTIYNTRSFSIKPLICLTTVDIVDASKNQISIQCRLNASNNMIVCPANSNISVSYRNVYCSYETVSDKAYKYIKEKTKNLPMQIVTTQQVSIRSAQEYASINIPISGVCRGWLGSFLQQNTTAAQLDNYALYNLPALQRVRLLVNGHDLEIKFPYNIAQTSTGMTDPLLLYDLMHSTVINSIRTDKRTVSGLYGARERDYFQTNGVIAQCFNPGISMSGNSTISAEILSGVSGQTWFLNMSFITFVDQLP